MATDTKKVQTLINIAGEQVQVIREAMATIQVVKSLYQTANPSTVGTPIDGQVAAINAAIGSLQTAADATVLDLLVNNIVPTHRGEAL